MGDRLRLEELSIVTVYVAVLQTVCRGRLQSAHMGDETVVD